MRHWSHIAGRVALLGLCAAWGAGCLVRFDDGHPEDCGNARFDPGEDCDDGNRMDGDGCSASCRLETGWLCTGEPSRCEPICGDDRALGPEVCDGRDLRGQTCEKLGLGEGELSCLQDCSWLDTSGCSGSVCGDGLVSGGEVCDGTNLAGHTCADEGFDGGELQCRPDCLALDTSKCSRCGNGIAEPGEECDGSDLGGKTCQDLGFSGGTLACTQDCHLDESGCLESCGNGRCEPDLGETAAGCPRDCGWTRVVGGLEHACGLRVDGSVWCWGASLYGRTGCAVTNEAVPAPVGIDATDIAAGQQHSCAVVPGGTVVCWGWNHSGQLGDQPELYYCDPQDVGLLSPATHVFAGWEHSCARTSDSAVWCWGHGSLGELGDGAAADSCVPVQASLSGYGGLAIGGTEAGFTCAYRGASLYCWGSNAHGQLGDGTTTTRDHPVRTRGIDGVRQACLGQMHTCAITYSGSVSCWGNGSHGQIGDGTAQDAVTEPRDVALPGPAVSIACGLWHTCVALEDGSVFCWGAGTDGQLGPAGTTDSTVPVQVPIQGAVSVGAGGHFSCAVKSDRTLWCWGRNQDGELGRGFKGGSDPQPAQVTDR